MTTPLIETMKAVLENGKRYADRTGTGRVRMFGSFERHSLANRTLPADTTTQLYLKTLSREIIAMKNGENSIDELGRAFWEHWSPTEDDVIAHYEAVYQQAKDDGNTQLIALFESDINRKSLMEHLKQYIGTIGPMYGVLWRDFPRVSRDAMHWVEKFEDIPSDKVEKYKAAFARDIILTQQQDRNTKENFERYCLGAFSQTFDQLAKVYKELRTDPYSSRHRITAYHPDLIGPNNAPPKTNVLNGKAALAPCHTFFQFMVTDNAEGKKTLNCMLYMSSSDVMIGRAYNICQYSLLTLMLAHCLDYEPGEFILTSCDTHIYNDHFKTPTSLGAEDQVQRQPLPYPTVKFNPEQKDFFKLGIDDFVIEGYQHHEKIPYKVSV